MKRWWPIGLAALGTLLIGAAIFIPQDDVAFEQSSCAAEESGLLLEPAQQAMAHHLTTGDISATVTVREEGSLMLGAYPRSEVLWTIRIEDPTLGPTDKRLEALALTAYCLRVGWVWINIPLTDGQRRLVVFSRDELDTLYAKNITAPKTATARFSHP